MLDGPLVRIGQIIGKPPGWERLVRALAPPDSFAGTGLDPRPIADGYVFPVDRGTLIGWSVYFFGTYEPEVRAEISRHLRAGGVAIDVGANVGWHTLLMAARVGAEGRVWAFEPNPTTRERLLAAVDANRLSQVRVDPRALADSDRVSGFEAPPAGHVWDGTGRLATASDVGRLVECTTLDAFAAQRNLDRVDLLKIDVEGFEPAVLRGASRMLRSMRPAVVFEYDPAYVSRSGTAADLNGYFRDCGYRLFLLRPRQVPALTGALAGRGGNFLALPSERIAES